MTGGRKALIAAAAVATIVAVLMLAPIGGDTRLVDCGANGTDCAGDDYYWSVGLPAIWLITELVGQEVHLVLFDVGAVLVGLALSALAAVATYLSVRAASRRA